MLPDEHNRLVPVSIPNEYIVHMYGKVDRLNIEVHLEKNNENKDKLNHIPKQKWIIKIN